MEEVRQGAESNCGEKRRRVEATIIERQEL
jgi:hypothetical protein